VRSLLKITLSFLILLLINFSCKEPKKDEAKANPRVFPGYHVLLDEIIRSREGVFRGVDLNAKSDAIKKVESDPPTEISPGHLYFEYAADSLTNYSIDYTFNEDSLEEIAVQINTNDLEYNCFEGERKPFVVSLSDNSSPSKGIINMVIYKDK
jgi:hypothetical protein